MWQVRVPKIGTLAAHDLRAKNILLEPERREPAGAHELTLRERKRIWMNDEYDGWMDGSQFVSLTASLTFRFHDDGKGLSMVGSPLCRSTVVYSTHLGSSSAQSISSSLTKSRVSLFSRAAKPDPWVLRGERKFVVSAVSYSFCLLGPVKQILRFKGVQNWNESTRLHSTLSLSPPSLAVSQISR